MAFFGSDWNDNFDDDSPIGISSSMKEDIGDDYYCTEKNTMSNKEFTQGEWTAHLGIMEPTYIFIGKEDDYIDGETPVICELYHGIKKKHPCAGIMDFDHTEIRANAALIAAAPDMYRVLSGICLEKSAQICKFAPESCKVCQIRKALKKAGGEE
jgi:hypothetical protein